MFFKDKNQILGISPEMEFVIRFSFSFLDNFLIAASLDAALARESTVSK